MNDAKCDDNSCSASYIPKVIGTCVFDPKWEAEFNEIPMYKNQTFNEKVLDGGNDRRTIYDTNTIDFHSRIALLRIKFEGFDNLFVGTATAFYINPITQIVYAITCAHNLTHYNKKTKKIHNVQHIWFDRRITSNWGLFCQSTSMKKYKIDKWWIHPQYTPDDVSPYDLGIISFKDVDNYYVINSKNIEFDTVPADFTQIYNFGKKRNASILQSAALATVCYNIPFDGVSIFGYPQEKRGQLWGDKISWDDKLGFKHYKDIFDEFLDGKMISYKLHTSGGQSGSPIVYGLSNSYIIGIHTGTNTISENWGVKIAGNTQWILGCVQSIERNHKKSNEILSLFSTNKPKPQLKTKIFGFHIAT